MKYLIAFLAGVAFIITLSFKTSYQGNQSAMVIERKSIYDIANEYGGKVEYKEMDDHKAVICGDTVSYDAASYTRCDEDYKYFHLIGYGHIEGSVIPLYFYRLNLKNGFKTIPELIIMYDSLKHQINKYNGYKSTKTGNTGGNKSI